MTLDYQEVYNDIANIIRNPNYQDGNHGPESLLLVWHTSGSYDKESKTGGSNHATVQFQPESDHLVNKWLYRTRAALEPLTEKYPQLKHQHGDLWTLAGVVGVQELGGPTVLWRPGRHDGTPENCVPEGRIPYFSADTEEVRTGFHRMGFTDQETVVLLGAHCLGRCHTDRSGYDGPWTESPHKFSNKFYKELLGRTWVEKDWKGPKQFLDTESKKLKMLPTDIILIDDPEYKKYVEIYSKDEKLFFEDFGKAFQKMMELNVPFPEGTLEIEFKRTPEAGAPIILA